MKADVNNSSEYLTKRYLKHFFLKKEDTCSLTPKVLLDTVAAQL